MNHLTPQVSVIIPTYNRGCFLGETIDSVRAQTFISWECIVVDDGSDDYTKELMEFYCSRDSRITYHIRPKNRKKGANACRNYGFENSKGNYINWFDSDDLMHPEKLEQQVTALQNSSHAFCVCQTAMFQDKIKNDLPLRFDKIVSQEFFYDYLRMKIGWLTQAPLWKRDFIEKQNKLFDEELQAAQEWEFHLRILKNVEEYLVLPDVLVYFRIHEKGITYNAEEDKRFWSYYQARIKLYRNEHLELAEKELDFLKAYLLNGFKKMVRENSGFAFKAFQEFILPDLSINTSAKFAGFLSLVSFRLFKRGNFMLQKIEFS
uniref:glycosyltransferase family 2 protein n=1 Tax=uncultured Christiangramia sp. TaxID=503836 RepID=UPI00262D91DF|nr:glycosyltransferase family 2 protein [uncultured Christiangramia sp.]